MELGLLESFERLGFDLVRSGSRDQLGFSCVVRRAALASTDLELRGLELRLTDVRIVCVWRRGIKVFIYKRRFQFGSHAVGSFLSLVHEGLVVAEWAYIFQVPVLPDDRSAVTFAHTERRR